MSEIDVSKCEYYYEVPSNDIECNSALESNNCKKVCYSKDNHWSLCEENTNCLYKQLKKEKQNAQDTYEMWQASLESIEILKQENEELKEILKTSCKYFAPGGECALTAKNCYGTSKCIEDSIQWQEFVIEKFNKTCKCKYLDHDKCYCSYYKKDCIAINQCLYKNQQKLERIKEYINDYGVMADDADCGLPVGILQIIEE